MQTLDSAGVTFAYPPVPETLYHYCDAYGLVGIVEAASWALKYAEPEKLYRRSLQLRASDVRYMNDAEELKFGAAIFRSKLKDAANDTSSSADTRELMGELYKYFEPERVFDWGMRAFASCFCSKGDLLSQWRGYAGGTGGFALGIDPTALDRHTQYFQPSVNFGGISETLLRPVIYGKREGARFADAVLADVRATAEHGGYVHDAGTGKVIPFYPAVVIFNAVTTMKHKAFKEEREWRLFAKIETQFPFAVDARRRGLVPYAEMAVNMNLPDLPAVEKPILDLVVGPCRDQAAQVAAAQELLQRKGHDPRVVRASNAPFTG